MTVEDFLKAQNARLSIADHWLVWYEGEWQIYEDTRRRGKNRIVCKTRTASIEVALTDLEQYVGD